MQGTPTPHPVAQPKAAFLQEAKGFSPERRRSLRYTLPLPLSVAACWNGRAVLLERAPTLKNISAGGLAFTLENGALDFPADAELEITVPLVEPTFHPARLYARCRARVLRREAPDRVAAEFNQVEFVREERASGLPMPLPALA